MRNFLAMLCAAFLLQALQVARAEEHHLVIVASADSSIKSMSIKEVRRVYLGAIIVVNGVEVKPLLNQSDKLVTEMFLQKVLFMSADAYERQSISRSFRGESSPKAYNDLADLLAALKTNNMAITFMSYDTAIATPGIRIIDNP
ncbi:MAG: hypothetical protein WBQ69_01750 [Gallionella sp.]